MKDLLLERIKKDYKPGEFFLISDLDDFGLSKDALKQEMMRLVIAGEISRYSYGMYYHNDNIDFRPDPVKAIKLRYISNKEGRIGFFTGNLFINQIKGIEPTASDSIEIISNKATSCKKSVYMFQKRFVIRRPYVEVTTENVAANALLSYITTAGVEEIKRNRKLLSLFATKNNVSHQDVVSILPFFPAKTSSKFHSIRISEILF